MQRRESVGDELELVNLLNDYCVDNGGDAPHEELKKSSTQTQGSPIKEAQNITEGLLEKLVVDKEAENQVKVVLNEKVRKGLEVTSEATLRDGLKKHFGTLHLQHMVEDYPNVVLKNKTLDKALDDANKENRALKAETRVLERSLQLALDGELEDTCKDKRLRAFREKTGKPAPPPKGKLAAELTKVQQELASSQKSNAALCHEAEQLKHKAEASESLEAHLSTAEGSLTEAKAAILKLQQECTAATERAKEAQQEINKLELKADEADDIAIEATRKEERATARADAVGEKVREAEEKLAQWLHDHIPEIELRRTNADITDELESKNRKVHALTNELAASAERITALRVDVKSSQSKIEVLEGEVGSLGTRLEEAATVLAAKDEETARLIEQLSTATNDARRTNEVEEELRKLHVEFEDNATSLRKTQERADRTEMLEAQNLRLKEEHGAATRKLDALSSRLGLAEVERVLQEENAKLSAALQADLPARAAVQQAVRSLGEVHEELKKQAMKVAVVDVAVQAVAHTSTAGSQTNVVTSPSEECVRSIPATSPLTLDPCEFLNAPNSLMSRKRSSTFTASPTRGNRSQQDWYELHNNYEAVTARLKELDAVLMALDANCMPAIDTPLAREHMREKGTKLSDSTKAVELEKELTGAELRKINKKLLRAVKIRRNHLAQSRVEDDILAAIQSQLGSVQHNEPLVRSSRSGNECLVSITLEVCTFPPPSSYVVLHVAGQQYKACVAKFTQEAFVLKFERSQILRLEVWDNEDKALGVAEVPITAAPGESEDVALEIDDMQGELRVGLTNAICKYGSPVRDRTSPMMWLEQLAPEQVDAYAAKLVQQNVIKQAADFELLHAVPFEPFVVFRLSGEAASQIDDFMNQSMREKLAVRCGLGLPPVSVLSKDDMVADHVDLTAQNVMPKPAPKPEPKHGTLFSSTGDEWMPALGSDKCVQSDVHHPFTTTLEDSKALLAFVTNLVHRMHEEGLGCGDAEQDLHVSRTLKEALDGVDALYRQAADDASPPRDARRRMQSKALENTAAALLTHSASLLRYRTWSKLLRLRARRARNRKLASYLFQQVTQCEQKTLLQKYYSLLEDNVSCADQLTLPVKTRLHRALRRESFHAPPQLLDVPLESKLLVELLVSGVAGVQCSDISLHCPPHSKQGKAARAGVPFTVHIDSSTPTHIRWTVHSDPPTSAYMVLDPMNLPSIQQLATDTAHSAQCFLTVEVKQTDVASCTPGESAIFPDEEHSLQDDIALTPTLRLDRALQREKLRGRCVDLTVLKVSGAESCILDVDGRTYVMCAGKSVALPFSTGYSAMRLSTPRHQGVTTAVTTAGLSKPWVAQLKAGVKVTLFASVNAAGDAGVWGGGVYQHEMVADERSATPGSSCPSPDEFDASEDNTAQEHETSVRTDSSQALQDQSHSHLQDRSVQSQLSTQSAASHPRREEVHVEPVVGLRTALHSTFGTQRCEGEGGDDLQATVGTHTTKSPFASPDTSGVLGTHYILTVHTLRGAQRNRTYSVGIAVNDLPMQVTDTAPAEDLRAIFNSKMHFTLLKSDVLKLVVNLMVVEGGGSGDLSTVVHLLPAHLPQDPFDIIINDKRISVTISDSASSRKVRLMAAAPGGWVNGGFVMYDGKLTCIHEGILRYTKRARPPAVMTSPSQSTISLEDEITSAASPIADTEERPVLKRLGTRKERKQKLLPIKYVDSTPMSNESLLDLFGEAGMMRGPIDGFTPLDSPMVNECAQDEKQDPLGGSMNSMASSHSVRSNFSSPPRRAPRKKLTVSPSLAPMSKDGSLYHLYLEQIAKQKAEEEEECDYSDEEDEEEKVPYPQCVYKAPEQPEPPQWHPYVLFPKPPTPESKSEREPTTSTSTSTSPTPVSEENQHDLTLSTTATSEAPIRQKLLITICSGKVLPESFVAVSLDGRGTQYTEQSTSAVWGETLAYPVATQQKQAVIFEVHSYAGGCLGQGVLVVDPMKFPRGEVVVKIESRLGHTDSAAGAELTVMLGLGEPKRRSTDRWSPPERLVGHHRSDRLSCVSTVLSSEKLSTLHLSHTSVGSDAIQRKASVVSSCLSDVSSETVLSPLTTTSQSPPVPPTVPVVFRKSSDRSHSEGVCETDMEVGSHRRCVRPSTVTVRDEGSNCVPTVVCGTSQTDLPHSVHGTLERSTSPPAGPILTQASRSTAVIRTKTPVLQTNETGIQSVPVTRAVGAMAQYERSETADKEVGTAHAQLVDVATDMTALEVLGMDFAEDHRTQITTTRKLKRSIGSNTDAQPSPTRDLLDLAKAQKEEAVKSAEKLLGLLKKSQEEEASLKQHNLELESEKARLGSRVLETERVAEDILKELKESRDEVELLLQQKCVNCDRLLKDINHLDAELLECREGLVSKEAGLATVLEQLQLAEVELQDLKGSQSTLSVALKAYEVAKDTTPPRPEHEWNVSLSQDELVAQRDFAAAVLADEVLRDPVLKQKCERRARDEFEVVLQKERRQFELELGCQSAEKPALEPSVPLRYASPPVTVRLDTPYETWKENEFVGNIAAVADIPTEDVDVMRVKKGSTIVTFRVYRDTKEEAEALGCKLATQFADPESELAAATAATDVDIEDNVEDELGKVRWCPESLGWLLETRGRLVADLYNTFCCLLLGGDNVVRAALMLERILNVHMTEVERLHLGLSSTPCESRVTDAQLSRLLIHSSATSPTRLHLPSKGFEAAPTSVPPPELPHPEPSVCSLSLSPQDSVVISPGSSG